MPTDPVVQKLRSMIIRVGSIQNISHGDIASGCKQIPVSHMSIVKSDADILRAQIRELAQIIGVEY